MSEVITGLNVLIRFDIIILVTKDTKQNRLHQLIKYTKATTLHYLLSNY